MLGLLASAINSLVLAVIQRDVTSRTALITWVALLAVISLLRYRDIRTFWRRSPDASEADRWGRRFIVGLALSGMAWGSSAIFLFPIESLAHQTFLAFVIGGMVAGAAAAFSSVMKAFLAYSVPALSPIILRFALLGDEFHVAMGGMAILFGVMMVFIAKRINTVRTASVKLRFKNSGLVSYITEHERMEEALRESEEKYRNLVEQSLQGIFVIQNMRIVFSNHAFADMSGYTIEELYSLSLEEVMNMIHPDDRKGWALLREGLEGKPFPAKYSEIRALRKDGSIAWVEYAAVMIRYGGRPAMQVSVVDRTQAREAERALRESQSRLETVFAAIPDPILEFDAEGRPVRANTAGLQVAGLSSSEVTGDQAIPMPEFKRPDGSAVKTEDLPTSRALQGETVTGDLYSIRTGGGLERVISTYAAPFRKDGKIHGVVALWHDVTELKQIEEALKKVRDELEERVKERTAELNSAYEVLQMEVEERRKAEKELRNLTTALQQAVEGVFVVAPDGAIVYANKAFCRMLGYREEELIGQYIWATRADNLEERSAQIWATINSGNIWTGRITRRRKDGVIIESETSVGPVRDDAGTIVNQVGVCRDITDQLRFEAQLRQAQKMEALGTLAGGIAHDFNNILAAVIGFAEIIEDDLPRESGQRRHTRKIVEAGVRGRDLVRQMLAFSSQSEQEKKPLRLSTIVKESVKFLRSSIPTTVNVRVSVESESGLVLGDPVQVQQILMNLATNAAYAMRQKGGTLDIGVSDFTVSSDRNHHGIEPGPYTKLTVSDTGAGIPAEIVDKIFDPFFTTKPLGQGTGLGLSVVHGIVKQHGGYITVGSDPGRGTTFAVYLPSVVGEAPTKTLTEEEIPAGHERVLFVDDEESLAEVGQRLLENLGYKVTVRTSSASALAVIAAEPTAYDFVITDQTMPEMTGVELARKILSLKPDMPVILATGFSHLVDAEQARAAGIRAFVMKPLTKREIARTVRKVLDG
jgi:PAS domain S-box-containing protein